MKGKVNTTVLERLQHNLAKQVPSNRITENADLQNDLGLDSLGLATLATDLHATLEFDLEYFADNLGAIRQVSDLVRVVEEALLITEY